MSSTASTTASGSCICGGVQYEVEGRMRDVIGCHCVECRKFSGHFTAATSVRPDDLRLLSTDSLKWYRASSTAQRGFCGECGSSLFWKPDSGDRVSIFAGSLDNANTLQLTSHIYVGEKGGYYDIADHADKHETTGAQLSVGTP